MDKKEVNKNVWLVLAVLLTLLFIGSAFIFGVKVGSSLVPEIRFYAGELSLQNPENNISIHACDIKLIVADLKNKELTVPVGTPCPK